MSGLDADINEWAQDRLRYRRAIGAIDQLHCNDPRRVAWHGTERPFELVYGWRMSFWRRRFSPEGSAALRLAVRGQHLCRWEMPRANWPAGRAGYLAWRAEQGARTAQRMKNLVTEVGYPESTGKQVAALVAKKDLYADKEAQALEDCAAMVFLELELVAFAARTDPGKLESVLQRTLKKMTPGGAETARRWLAEATPTDSVGT